MRARLTHGTHICKTLIHTNKINHFLKGKERKSLTANQVVFGFPALYFLTVLPLSLLHVRVRHTTVSGAQNSIPGPGQSRCPVSDSNRAWQMVLTKSGKVASMSGRGDEEGLLVIVGSRPKKEVGRVGQALCPSRAEACEQRVQQEATPG